MPLRFSPRHLAVAAAFLALAAPALAQSAKLTAVPAETPNLVAASSFAFEGVSLQLPEVSPFPLIVGGWGARAANRPVATLVPTDANGGQALELSGVEGRPAHVIQDLPRGSSGFVLRASVQRFRGRQSIAIMGSWDRMDPAADALVRVEFRGTRLQVASAGGTWLVPVPLSERAWHDVLIRADPRTGQIEVWIDAALVAAVPGNTTGVPQTIILGAQHTNASTFRYDDIELYRLPDIELIELRHTLLDLGATPSLLARLDAARDALARGAARMAASELRAVARALAAEPEANTDGSPRAALGDLIELIAAR